MKPNSSKLRASKVSNRSVRAYKTGATTRIRRTDPYTDDWYEISAAVKRRDGYKCVKCPNTTNLEVHHIVPVSKGGTNAMNNLITLCHKCHSKQPRHKHMR